MWDDRRKIEESGTTKLIKVAILSTVIVRKYSSFVESIKTLESYAGIF